MYMKQNNKIEKMTNTNTINEQTITALIKKIYKTDVNAIRNLADIADKLQGKGKYKNKKIVLPGNLEIRDSLTVGRNFNYLPRGTIVIYNGTRAPSGWALCNGSNGTPNLKGKFVYGYGAGAGRKFKGSGGAETHKLTTKEMPAHSHGVKVNTKNQSHNHKSGRAYKVTKYGCMGCAGVKIMDYGRNKKNTSTTSTSHNHSASSYNKGGSRGHNNMPPYIVLSYIMKL